MQGAEKKYLYSLQEQDFSVADEYQKLRSQYLSAGAIVTFSGLVRDIAKNSEAVKAIELKTYPAMTNKQIDAISKKITQRFDIQGLTIIHRFGYLQAQEQIVFVGVAGQHRRDAFAAAEMAMDFLKSKVAFWKKEHYQKQNEHQWIQASDDDKAALERWND